MGKISKIIGLAVICCTAASCSWAEFRRQVGATVEAPDEYEVMLGEKLTMPDDWENLPKPEEKQDGRSKSREDARDLLFTASQQSNAALQYISDTTDHANAALQRKPGRHVRNDSGSSGEAILIDMIKNHKVEAQDER